MNSLSSTEASQNLDDIINQIKSKHQAVMIKGSQNDAIVVSKEYWSAMQETIYRHYWTSEKNVAQDTISFLIYC